MMILMDLLFLHSDAADLAANIHIVIPTTPAQYFHALRRQVVARFALQCYEFYTPSHSAPLVIGNP